MKRYFVRWAVASLLALTGLAKGQTNPPINLQLILEGPFVICENATSPATLTIAIPYLQGTHYIPALTSGLDSKGLGERDNPTRYSNFPDQTDYQMAIWKKPVSHPVKLMPDRDTATPTAFFYSEAGGCGTLNKDLVSVTLTVPAPNEVWALSPTESAMNITDHHCTPKTVNCTLYGEKCADVTNGCKYSTKIVLRYKNVDGPICVTGDSDSWCPSLAAAIGGELEIELNTEPIESGDEASAMAHAKAAFWQASRLSGVYRDLGEKPGSKHQYPLLHKVCQVPPVFLCTTCPK